RDVTASLKPLSVHVVTKCGRRKLPTASARKGAGLRGATGCFLFSPGLSANSRHNPTATVHVPEARRAWPAPRARLARFFAAGSGELLSKQKQYDECPCIYGTFVPCDRTGRFGTLSPGRQVRPSLKNSGREFSALRMRLLLPLTLLLSLLVAAPLYAAEERIVSLNGDITEIIFGLGLGEYVVAVDASSNYPAEVLSLPNLGYQGNLNAEAILAFQPTKVLASPSAGPKEVLEQVMAAGVEVIIIDNDGTINAPVDNIRTVAALLGVPEKGEQLAQAVQAKIDAAVERGRQLDPKPRVLFLYLGSTRFQFGGGAGTPSNAMIEAAGAIDAGKEVGLVGYQPITAEVVAAAQPDVVIVTERGLNVLGSIEGVIDGVPGLALTPAGQKGHILVFEDLYFIGMGPRTGDALLELVEALERLQ